VLRGDKVHSSQRVEASPTDGGRPAPQKTGLHQLRIARVAAANTLLDRAYGKAPTFSTSDTQVFKRAIDMTDDELAAIVGRAKLTLVKSDT
jgi:hypothetical protein